MTDGVDVLIVAAFHPELAGLRALLVPASAAQASSHGEDVSARVSSLHVVASAVGIGMPNAAVGAASRVATRKPRAVVLVGTCGAYAERGFAIGDVAVAAKVRLVEPAVCEGRAAIPGPMSVSTDAHPALGAQLLACGGEGGAVRAANIATTLAVTTDDALAAMVARASSSNVEHLEAFAVATACAAFGVPFVAVLGVANVVGSSAREQWRVNHRATADAAAGVVFRWLQAGAPGLPPR